MSPSPHKLASRAALASVALVALVAAACSSTSSAGDGGASGGGSGGSTEARQDNKVCITQRSLNQDKDPCSTAADCKGWCCQCDTSFDTNSWTGAICEAGKCLDQATTCQRTRDEEKFCKK